MRRIHGVLGLSLFAGACAAYALGCFYDSTVDPSTPCDEYWRTDCDGGSGVGGSTSGSTSSSGVPATCNDGMLNGDETDGDCGGSCPDKCADAKGCAVGSDCMSGVCDMGAKTCSAPTCMDMVKNGTETDVDCGGSCVGLNPPQTCSSGKGCNSPADCKSGSCTASLCDATCSDNEKNQNETDIDCGGMTCVQCNPTQNCLVDSDCKSGKCTGNVCQVATCSDSVQNQDESDVDCGGGCAIINPPQKCDSGKKCNSAFDCKNGMCVPGDGGKVCQ